jgi:hypothetical protein
MVTHLGTQRLPGGTSVEGLGLERRPGLAAGALPGRRGGGGGGMYCPGCALSRDCWASSHTVPVLAL